MEPIRNHNNPLYGARSELCSAMSALNMEPTKIENPPEGAFYLSELDQWASHSMERLMEVNAQLGKVTQKLVDIQSKVIGLFGETSEENVRKELRIILDDLSRLIHN